MKTYGRTGKVISNPNLKIKFEGDWFRTTQLINHSDKLIGQATFLGMAKAGDAYEKELKKNIKNGGKKFRYPPLSTAYEKSKRGIGNMFIYTKNLLDSIKTVKNPKTKYVRTGIEPGHKKESGGLTSAEYGTYLETGTRKQPKRPIFTDTYQSMGSNSFIKDFIRVELIRALAIIKMR